MLDLICPQGETLRCAALLPSGDNPFTAGQTCYGARDANDPPLRNRKDRLLTLRRPYHRWGEAVSDAGPRRPILRLAGNTSPTHLAFNRSPFRLIAQAHKQ